MRRLAVLVVIALAAMAGATAAAQAAPQPKTSLNAVEADVMCVSCGVPLAMTSP